MAENRSYLREVKQTDKEDYRDKIKKHRMSAVYRFLIVMVILLIVVGIVYIQYRNHIYTAYDMISTENFERIGDTEILKLGENILTYSNDGAQCVNAKGEALWNQTFEMQDILVTSCEDVVAFADYNGREIYVLNTAKKLCEISTTMPIRSLAVAANGRVAVAVADTKITWIYIYDADGTLAYEIKTTMAQSGYPITFSLSPNGELLGLTCVYVDEGVIKSNVAFHNFGAVGSNMSDYRVSADIYPDTIVPYIQFINDDTAIAVGEDRMLVYKGSQKPVLKTQYIIEDEIQAVYHNERYVGILLHSDKLEMRNRMDIYDCNLETGNKIGNYYFNLTYDDIFFTEDYFVAYNEAECFIQTYDEVVKYEGDFLTTADLFMPVGKGKSFKYVLVSRDSIHKIQLK